MDEDVQKIKKRTRRKKRSNTKRENNDFVSTPESNISSNVQESPVQVKRVLRNRNITDEDVVVKKRTRKRRKKKSIPEDMDNTESSVASSVKSSRSAVSSLCISSADDSKPQNSSKKVNSELRGLKRSISYNPAKQDEFDIKVTRSQENDDQDEKDVKNTSLKKKKKLKKQPATEMDVSHEDKLINNTFEDGTESYRKTPATKLFNRKKSNAWTEATEHNFGESDITTNSKRETYQLENNTAHPLLSTPAKKKSLRKKQTNEWTEATEANFGDTDIATNSKRATYQLESSTVQPLLSTPANKKSLRKKQTNEWTEATEANFGDTGIATNSKRETYQLESSTVQPSLLTPANKKSSSKKKNGEWIEATEHNFGEINIETNSKQETYELESSTVQLLRENATPANKKSSKKKTGEWIAATEHNFGGIDIETNSKRETYQLENKKSSNNKETNVVTSLSSSAIKQRKKWDLSNTTLNYSTDDGTPVIAVRNRSLFGAALSNSTPETSVTLSTRASTVRKTPFVTKNGIVKLGGSQIKKRDSFRKSTLKNNAGVNFLEEVLGVDPDSVVLKNKRRSYSVDEVTSRTSKVSFAVKDQEIVDTCLISDDDDSFKESDDKVSKDRRRTYSFDGIEKVPFFSIANSDKTEDENNTDMSLLNHSFLQDSPKLLQNESFGLTDDSFVTRRRHNTPKLSRKTSPTTEFTRTSLSKKLSKSKVSPKLSTTLKASRKTPRISGEKVLAFLDLINDSDSKPLRGRPSGTSTPHASKTTSVAKLAQTKKNITFNESVSSPSIAKIKRSRMPNFSLIHQKQFERMESISKYKERHEERAKELLSGNKVPHCYSNAKNPNVKNSNVTLNISTKVTCNKQLEFNKSIPTTSKTPKKTNAVASSIKNKTPNKILATLTAAIASTSNPPLSSKTGTIPKRTFTSHLPVKKKLTVAEKNLQQKPKVGGNAADSKNSTRFGFTRIPAKSSKEELVALANKTRVPKVNVQARRNIIQGVRSNRRFELLMNMRKK